MKDRRFIELVNLYVDRQITAAEASELEAEIQADPSRRAIYHQYCQMQKATTLVYESFRTSADGEQTDVAPGRATVTRFEELAPRRRTNWNYYAAGLAAACLALVLVRMNSNRSITDQQVVVTAPAAPQVSAPATVVAAQTVPVRTTAPETRAGLVSLRNNLGSEQDYAAMVAALRQQEQRAFANSQNQSNRLPSLFDDGVFDTTQQGFSTGSQRTFRSKQAPAQQAEFTAFQFQR